MGRFEGLNEVDGWIFASMRDGMGEMEIGFVLFCWSNGGMGVEVEWNRCDERYFATRKTVRSRKQKRGVFIEFPLLHFSD